ncbi:MAG: hypothetical protein K2N73_03720, partial [Lachnospiraceae bacterium]|nr:hypothetical protein [Lachnospiraceae bacterium]
VILANIDYNVQLIRFPSTKIHEAVTPNEDGSVTIFIDKNITFEAQQKRFLHAMKHLMENDFDKDDVQKIEAEAHS